MKFEYTKRRIFNDILKEEIIKDFYNRAINKVLDIGCGDCYLLNLLKTFYNSSDLYCIEKHNIYEVSSCSSVKQIELNTLSLYEFDVVTFVDVLYLIDSNTLNNIFEKLRYSIRKEGIIYIVLGIYKESRGIELFRKKLTHIDKYNIYSLEELLNVFEKYNYKVFVKRMSFESTFGIKINSSYKHNLKKFIDYLYEDKLLFKLCI